MGSFSSHKFAHNHIGSNRYTLRHNSSAPIVAADRRHPLPATPSKIRRSATRSHGWNHPHSQCDQNADSITKTYQRYRTGNGILLPKWTRNKHHGFPRFNHILRMATLEKPQNKTADNATLRRRRITGRFQSSLPQRPLVQRHTRRILTRTILAHIHNLSVSVLRKQMA